MKNSTIDICQSMIMYLLLYVTGYKMIKIFRVVIFCNLLKQEQNMRNGEDVFNIVTVSFYLDVESCSQTVQEVYLFFYFTNNNAY